MSAKAECKIAQCSRPSRARGMCGAHYERWRNDLPLALPIGKMFGRQETKVSQAARARGMEAAA